MIEQSIFISDVNHEAKISNAVKYLSLINDL